MGGGEVVVVETSDVPNDGKETGTATQVLGDNLKPNIKKPEKENVVNGRRPRDR